MKKLLCFFKNLPYRHYIGISMVLFSAGLTALCYRFQAVCAWESVLDLLDAMRYYFLSIAHAKTVPAARIAALPALDLSPVLSIPVAEISRRLTALFPALFTREMLVAYTDAVGDIAGAAALLLLPAVLLVVTTVALLRLWLLHPNGRAGEKTRALQKIEARSRTPCVATVAWLRETADFFAVHRKYLIATAVVWSVNLNLFPIAAAAVGFYFYFSAAFDVASLFVFAVRVLTGALIASRSACLAFWLFVGWRVLCRIREWIGYHTLEAGEASNRDVIAALPCLTITQGTMGAKKTTLITDMALSCTQMFRQKALEQMIQNDLRFPCFNFAAFRGDLKDAMARREVYSLRTVEGYLQRRHAAYVRHPSPETVWGYDDTRYPMTYNSDLKIIPLWEALTNYAKQFFIYTMNSSMLVANYSIREDLVLLDYGNLPIWDQDIFHRDPRARDLESEYAHILDFDLLRLGKKMLQDNPAAGSLEFGVVNITEIGKERGNMNTLKELRRLTEECNQKNDRFEDYLKMIRHPAVVENYVYIKCFTDDQRAMSWAADGRELATIINVSECSPVYPVLPFFTWAEMFFSFFRGRWENFKVQYDSIDRDMCAPVFYVQRLLAACFAIHERTTNRFGRMVSSLTLAAGDEESDRREVPYYLATKKIYSERFATNCHKGMFERAAARTRVGIADYPTYSGILATDEELQKQHSFFITETTTTETAAPKADRLPAPGEEKEKPRKPAKSP